MEIKQYVTLPDVDGSRLRPRRARNHVSHLGRRLDGQQSGAAGAQAHTPSPSLSRPSFLSKPWRLSQLCPQRLVVVVVVIM